MILTIKLKTEKNKVTITGLWLRNWESRDISDRREKFFNVESKDDRLSDYISRFLKSLPPRLIPDIILIPRPILVKDEDGVIKSDTGAELGNLLKNTSLESCKIIGVFNECPFRTGEISGSIHFYSTKENFYVQCYGSQPTPWTTLVGKMFVYNNFLLN